MGRRARQGVPVPELSDYHAYLAKQEQKKRAEAERAKLAAAPVIREHATQAQRVLNHPAWQWFAEQLDSRVNAVEARRTSTTTKMIFGNEMGHELELLKIELNTMDAEIRALRYAQTLCAKAVDMGKEIAEAPLTMQTYEGFKGSD